MCSHILLYEGRVINPVGDRFLFKIPGKSGIVSSFQSFLALNLVLYKSSIGWASLLEAYGVIPGTVKSCAAILKKGNLLAIAPGGVYEAQLGDNNYELLWKQRIGFAKVALEARVVRAPFR